MSKILSVSHKQPRKEVRFEGSVICVPYLFAIKKLSDFPKLPSGVRGPWDRARFFEKNLFAQKWGKWAENRVF